MQFRAKRTGNYKNQAFLVILQTLQKSPKLVICKAALLKTQLCLECHFTTFLARQGNSPIDSKCSILYKYQFTKYTNLLYLISCS